MKPADTWRPAARNDGAADTLPTIELDDAADNSVRVLRELQKVILKHPVAAQSMFNALIAEGRAFAETPDGQRWQHRLERSALLQQAGLLFDLATLSMLEQDPPDILPSSYFDVLFMLAGDPAADHILNRLFDPGDSPP